MNVFTLITEAAARRDLAFLVIGGHAVNAAGYARVTADIDLLACQDDRGAWTEVAREIGYTVFNDGATFLQLTPPASLAAWPLDLMFVARSTLDAMVAAALQVEMAGAKVAIPAPSHLIALKLHALKTGGADRQGRDFQDVVGLIRVAGMDVRAPEVRQLFERYGTMDWYERTVTAVLGSDERP